MTSPTYQVSPLNRSIQYTGSNSTDIDNAVSPFIDFVIVSESGGTLNATSNSSPIIINTGDWVIYSVSSVFSITNALYLNEWNCFATCDDLASSMSGSFVRSMGVAPVPLLLASGSTTVSVQLSPAMPDSTYTAYASKFAGVSVVDLNITSVTVVDADTVNVGVQNVGLLTLTGASIMVHAIE